MIYRQRQTFVDDFLLQVVCPWLVALHATPLLRLAHIWREPAFPAAHSAGAGERIKEVWSKVAAWNYASSTHGTYPRVKHEQSRVN